MKIEIRCECKAKSLVPWSHAVLYKDLKTAGCPKCRRHLKKVVEVYVPAEDLGEREVVEKVQKAQAPVV